MKCPRDGTILSEVEILGLQLDKCHKCDGIWFDAGELKKLREARVPHVEEALEEKYGDPEVDEDSPDGYMRCPRCGERLLEHHYTYINPVRVDRCSGCFGFWLDDSELDAVVGEERELDQEAGRVKGFLQGVFQKLAGSGG